ncbi:DEAD/DEAH box helicase [Nocardioides baekrokdamisoli]|uniref:RNA helicase n=1 Tax=Nocardioides baekrokdamisoli TaxID=1804624 RepID=A0A3G9IZ55_9ACTN|nr:DEAD/DEAH box helicase [Nocardioides baekrokdamisoli]BBH16474.1 DEAD/DEAH box helicase [Nocardioides baekrokdamisoli]
MTTFRDLGVLPEICDALERKGIVEPFAIQEMTLSVALGGTDLIGQARTGTGKTLAFGIPVVQRTVSPKDRDYAEIPQGKPQALIIAPTRELALQVSGDISLAAEDRGIRVLTIYGGVGFDIQTEALATGVEIVVGTPGRLLDLANRKILDLSHVHALVLDEADEMLDLGFLEDIQKLVRLTPETRQTMLFSATMPGPIVALARSYMRTPMNIRAESSYDQQTVPATTQYVYQAHDLDKPEMIGRLLQGPNVDKVVVFSRTKRQAQRVADDLTERGFNASPLHGDMAQVAREKAMQRFRDGKVDILVCTDVAARGIDVSGVSHVINYTTPDDHKTYVHRIGRTGRAGASGIAVTLVDWADLHKWKLINKELDLPFHELVETYSGSDNFLHDMGIPRGTKGRIKPAAPPAPKADRPANREGGSSAPRTNNRDRSRTRSRGGEVVAGETGSAPKAETTGPAAEGDAAPRTANRNRNRRRRRPSGSGEAAAAE